MDEALTQFVRESLGKGLSKKEIGAKLVEVGWPEDEVRTALAAWADVEFAVPIPKPKPYLSAREAFTYLALFGLLYACAWSFGSLLFQLIHHALPDSARTYTGLNLRAIRWSIAVLLVASPGYFWLSVRSYRAARLDPERRQSRVRKWLTYLTLLVAGGTLVGDLMALVFSLLQGDLTVRFVLKVLVVGSIAGAVFGYYLWDLKQDDAAPGAVKEKHPFLRAFAVTVVASVVATLAVSLFLAGSPGSARRTNFDQTREQNLIQIASQVDTYWSQFAKLPDSLEALQSTRGYHVGSITDPETGVPYEFTLRGERDYELCATFTAPSEQEPKGRYTGLRSKFWEHGAGRTCYDVTVHENRF